MNAKINSQIEASQASLHTFALQLTRHNPDEAKDLYQETLYRVLAKIDSFDPDSNFLAWSRTIMRNIFINAYRKRKKRFQIEQQIREYNVIGEVRIVTNAGEENLRYEEVREQVECLSIVNKVPFLMVCMGYSYREIAAELNLPIGTIKSRIFLARKKLRRLCEQDS